MRRRVLLLRRDGLVLLRYRFPGGGGAEAWSTTRCGGLSTGSRRGLNLDPRGGDDPAAVSANQRLLLSALAIAGVRLPRQVHGGRVLEAGGNGLPGFSLGEEADGLVGGSGVPLGVLTADCLPVVLSHSGGAMAAVHAGWRGVVAGVVPAAVALLLDRWGGSGRDVAAWMGPCIGPCCYRVGQEVVASVARAGVPEAVAGGVGEPRLDLRRAVATQLYWAGLRPRDVASAPLCTSCSPELFYSHRRDRGETGRMVTVAVRR